MITFAEQETDRCDVGSHDVPAGDVLWCAVCNQGVCFEHLGNPLDALDGDLAACPEHIKRVAEMNRVVWAQMRVELVRLGRGWQW